VRHPSHTDLPNPWWYWVGYRPSPPDPCSACSPKRFADVDLNGNGAFLCSYETVSLDEPCVAISLNDYRAVRQVGHESGPWRSSICRWPSFDNSSLSPGPVENSPVVTQPDAFMENAPCRKFASNGIQPESFDLSLKYPRAVLKKPAARKKIVFERFGYRPLHWSWLVRALAIAVAKIVGGRFSFSRWTPP